MLPNAQDLKYFIEVSKTLNLTRASERLGISQPSLSVSIQRLENNIGVPLLIRGKKGVALTQAGQALLTQAHNIIDSWENLKEKATSTYMHIAGQYTIGCHPSVALYSLPHIIPSLLENYPQLEIKCVHDLSRRMTESVISMQVSVGIVVNPVPHPDLVIQKLCSDIVTFWKGKENNPLQDPYSGKGVLICDPDLIQTQDLLKKIKKTKIKYRTILSSSNLEVIAELVASGSGFGIIPGKVAKRQSYMKLQKIKRAPVFYDEVCAIYRIENKNVPAIQIITQKLKKALI
ncbi:MAG: LysR family transcriptional regulator [Deltaproteobacteria bacterium]|nr:LysR family transcriptional regulator [Deltaproteobacteria bacterium]